MALVQTREHLLGGLELEHERLIALRFLFKARQRLIDRGDVGQHELGLNGFDVALRVDLLETCSTLGSLKKRTTSQIASVSRMLARTCCPGPRPCSAPATRPAMSTNSTVAGTILAGWSIFASSSKR